MVFTRSRTLALKQALNTVRNMFKDNLVKICIETCIEILISTPFHIRFIQVRSLENRRDTCFSQLINQPREEVSRLVKHLTKVGSKKTMMYGWKII